jgi:mannose-6-phosphate isomerase-like protein (cupin superfamily)
MFGRFAYSLAGTVLVGLMCGAASAADASVSVETMLQEFVEDFKRDPFAEKPITFGIRIKDAEPADWHVVVGRSAEGEDAEVRLARGFPEEPILFFIMDRGTLAGIHAGELASLTAMGKAKSADFAPLDIDGVPGLEVTPELVDHVKRLSFHFWTRGFPEVVRFGDMARTRVLHGANAVLFYYQEGFRSGWFEIEKGQHVNQEESEQTNPFPSMIIVTKGTMMSRLGGEEHVLKAGETIYIGAGVSHEFWNDQDEPAEGVLVMFGEGA